MKKQIVLKALLCVVIGLFFGFMGLFAAVIVAFMGGERFYAPLILVTMVMMFAYIVIQLFGWFKPRTRNILFIGYLGICVLAIGGYEINRAYHNSFETVNEQGVNLELYKPFVENTKAVKLDRSAGLKLEENLPRLDGATALYPLYAAFAQAVYPEKDYNIYRSEVTCNNTVGSYDRLIRGETDIVFAARPSKDQLAEAKRMGVELILTPIGREAFVFFVNSQNTVDNLATEEIQDIYSGRITNWKDVGGRNEKIRAFQRPENSGSQTMLQHLMEGRELMTPPKEDVVAGMGGIIKRTANYRNYKNAIGYSFRFFATEMVRDNQIRLLQVDGVYPQPSTIKSKEYPLAAEFYAVTAGEPEGNVKTLIEWILSDEGQELVEKTGYTAVGEE